MMRYKTKHTKNTTTHYSVFIMRLAALIAVLTLISLYMLSGVYSKFYSTASGSDNARVAKFSPDFTATEIIVNNRLPGYSAEIPFEVKNYSDDNPAEVAMKYKIVLKTTGNIPLTFTLTDSAKNTLETWECDGISGERIYEYANNSLVFGVGTKKTDSYKLKIEWLSSEKDAMFSGLTDAIYLSAEFEQID